MSRTARLWLVLAANLGLVGALLAVGVAARSIGVWAEGADYLGDAAGVGAALLAIHLARRPPTAQRPEGHPRATRYAALANAGWLLMITVLLAAGAIDRLAAGAGAVSGLPVLVVSGVAGVVMLAAALLLGEDLEADEDVQPSAAGSSPSTAFDDEEEHGRLAVKAVMLDTAADAAAAAGVALSGGVIYATGGNFWLDPAVALVIAALVAYQALRLAVRIGAALRR